MKEDDLRKKSYLNFMVLLILLLVAATVILPKYKKYNDILLKTAQIEQKLDLRKRERNALQDELDALKSDPNAIERVAREKFRYCKSGEKIYHFDTQPILKK